MPLSHPSGIHYAAEPLLESTAEETRGGSGDERLTCKLTTVRDCACLEADQLVVLLPANNLLTTLHSLVPTMALLWRREPSTPAVLSSYRSPPGSLRLLIDILSCVWQHDQ